MGVTEPRRFYESLEKGEIADLYLFFGEEVYLMNQALQELVEKSLDGGARDFNLDVFYAGDDDLAKVRDAAETLPMMASRRVVVLREAQSLKAKDWETLLPIIENPIDMSTVVILTSSVDQRLKFFKEFSKRGTVVEFKRPTEVQLPDWVKSIAKKYKKSISEDAAQLVGQMVGTNLTDVDHEMQKLSQFIADRKTIEEKDVRDVVSSLRVDTVFKLADAIGSNDRSSALICLANLLDHGESPIGITALVARHVRILALVRDGVERGLTSSQLSQRSGVPSFFIRKYVDQSRAWSLIKLEQAQSALLSTDRALKSSPISPHIWLENFILHTCQSA